MIRDLLVVGGGISGLALARELQAQGRAPLVLERARGVGGRCATRRVDGQPVDHGLAFLHGSSPAFLAALEGLPEPVAAADWPRERVGDGVACQPRAFDEVERRIAPAAGVSSFARHLARGLDVRLEARVDSLSTAASPAGAAGKRVWQVALAGGERLQARAVVLTMPAPSAGELLRGMDPPDPAVAALLPLLGMIRMLPCLAVIARYPPRTPAPAWQASHPREGALQTILHDSSKRAGAPRLVLVLQARPGFSREHRDDPPEAWTRTLLEEAAALHGAWVLAPDLVQSHRWGNARVAAGSELAAPLVARLDGGLVLGIAGDGLHAAGGVEGAYRSGIALAARLGDARPAPPSSTP